VGESRRTGGADYHRCGKHATNRSPTMAKKSRKKKARKKSSANHGKRPNS